VLGDGSFLRGVTSGFLFVSAGLLQQKIQAPPIKPGRILWDKVEPELDGDRHVVMFGRWSVTIEVFAAWYVDEDDLEFRFRLQGLDEGWRDRGRRSSIRLDSLPPGDYQLEAQTFNRLAGFGPVETIIKLQVRNPRWANKLLIAPFAAAGKVWRISEALFRNRALLERNVELEREVQARTADIEQAKSLLEAMNKELASQTVTDALTGISNRRHFDERFEQDLHEASRTGEPLSLILIDIDHFKPYNDLYGHAQGDKCLSYVARKLESTLYRPNDLVARYGGEEFVVVLPNVDRQGAVLTAERLRNSIVSLAMAHDGAPGSKRVTISLGATTLQTPLGLQVTDLVATRLIECADAALYEAKETGRNRYVFRSAPDFGL